MKKPDRHDTSNRAFWALRDFRDRAGDKREADRREPCGIRIKGDE